jgi:hypothetical protein
VSRPAAPCRDLLLNVSGPPVLTRAGLAVAIAIIWSSVKPRFRNLVITEGRNGVPDVLPEKT